ncbi:MAG: hypothetical protein GY716_17905 [bacterium]|nr:hypothetical protein [bacterium]
MTAQERKVRTEDSMQRHWIRIAGTALILASASTALATNGMYLAGYGTEANGRGGANIAVADRALGLHANPAGITQLMGNHFSVDVQLLMPQLDYADGLGNDIAGEDQVFAMPSFSYVRGGRETSWAWGISLVSQGGMGADFNGYMTPFGSEDDTFSEVRFGRVIPTVAYSFTENLSVGLSANLGWSDVTFDFWPDTSFYDDNDTLMDPLDDVGFFGLKMKDAPDTFNYSFRAGLMWRLNEKLQLGFIYETETESDYDGGTLIMDQASLMLGKVAYDAAVKGFTWPEQYGVGLQYRPAEDWVLAFDAKRYRWAGAIDVIRVQATNPDNAMTPITMQEIPFVFNWDDQWVYAAGVEHRLNDTFTLRFGGNYGESPVPDDTLNPLFPATVEAHATAGLGWNIGTYTVNFAVERGFENSQTNDNTDQMVNPFGPGVTVDHSQWTISFGFSKAFSRN